MPSVFSRVPRLTPRSSSTMKAVIPRLPFSGSLLAKTMKVLAKPPLVTKIFVPVRM